MSLAISGKTLYIACEVTSRLYLPIYIVSVVLKIRNGGFMFEHDQEIVNSLLNKNDNFKRLYEKHSVIKSTVKKANEGNGGIDQLSLEELKKEKLDLKDRMSLMIENYRHTLA